MDSRKVASLAAAVIVPAVVFIVQGHQFRQRNGITYDETFYLTTGKQIFQRGSFESCAIHGVAPLPLVLEYGPAIWLRGDKVSNYIWISTDDDPASVDVARATTMAVIGLPILLLTAGWVYCRTGSSLAAGGAATLLALSPNFVAHATLATTDACFTLFFLAAAFALGKYAVQPKAGRFVAAGALLGLALAAKYSGLILFPIAYLISLAADVQTPGYGLRQWIVRAGIVHPARTAGLALMAFVVCWVVTGFEVSKSPLSARSAAETPAGEKLRKLLGTGPLGDTVIDLAHRLHLPSPAAGIIRQFVRNDGSIYPTHLLGQTYPHGHRLYYVYAFLMKSTPAELSLLLVIAVGWIASRPSHLGELALWAGIGLLFLGFSLSAKQFGLRYLLPIYPALAMSGVVALYQRLSPRPGVLVAVLVGLVGWQAVSADSIAPRQLSYLNSIAGGPEGGPWALGTSDMDWGQGLMDLKEFLDREGEQAVLARAVGPTQPSAYGITILTWQPYSTPPCRYIAISAGLLARDPARDPRYEPFRQLRPTEQVGYSVFVYDTTDPDVWRTYCESVQRLEAARQDSAK